LGPIRKNDRIVENDRLFGLHRLIYFFLHGIPLPGDNRRQKIGVGGLALAVESKQTADFG
jgi:hypothetical protein